MQNISKSWTNYSNTSRYHTTNMSLFGKMTFYRNCWMGGVTLN